MRDPASSDPLLNVAQSHIAAGQFEQAAAMYRDYLRVHPKDCDALEALGTAYLQMGQFERAQYFLGEAARLDQSRFNAWRLRGAALMQLKRHTAALACFEHALSVKPDSIEALVNRAVALFELKRFDEALAALDRALALDATNAVAWTNRGNVLTALTRLEEAVTCYDQALSLQPDLETAKQSRFLVLLQLRRVTRIADHALREMFDEVSPRFDTLMVDTLNYRAHLQVRAMAERAITGLAPPLTILDLGCGTGLVGDAFKDLAAGGRLDGIDIAPRMIEAARRRGIYDELILDDLETTLAAPGRRYDLILSADTMIYLGDLTPTFSGVANRLLPGGFYIFAVESKTGEGWEQTAANRFRHSESYLRDETARAGLCFIDLTETVLRREADEPVAGFVLAIQARR
jgi:predicted TPR repeat methyltransferase